MMLRIIEKYRHSFFILNAIKSSQISRLCPSDSPKLIESLFKWCLEGLLKENRGGRHRSYMMHEEEEAFLKEQLSSSLNGEFLTVNSLFKAY